mmetsp:Transcript_7788/g.13425  ORF Transcript_7788/g.13425 Transcript_7788/m.13425 type:complete len:252 (-) Transcript_7788:8-763(-)
MLDGAVVDVAHLDRAIGIPDHQHVTDIKEQPVLHHAGDLVQHQAQLRRLRDAAQVQVENEIALVGAERLRAREPQRGRTPQNVEVRQHFLDQRLCGLPAEGDDLHRQRERAKGIDLLGRVGDDDHLVARRSHDLLVQKRAAAALDQVQVRVVLVGSVDRQVQPAHLVECLDGDPHFACQIRRAGGGGNARDHHPLFPDQFAEAAHHPGRGRAGSEPHAHAVFHEFHGAPCGDVFCFVDRGKLGRHGRDLFC